MAESKLDSPLLLHDLTSRNGLSTKQKIVMKKKTSIWVFPKIGVPQNPKMDDLKWKTLLKWMMLMGFHYSRKHPYSLLEYRVPLPFRIQKDQPTNSTPKAPSSCSFSSCCPGPCTLAETKNLMNCSSSLISGYPVNHCFG